MLAAHAAHAGYGDSFGAQNLLLDLGDPANIAGESLLVIEHLVYGPYARLDPAYASKRDIKIA